MNLVSCNNCGVVFDADILNFPSEEEMYDEDGDLIDSKVVWAGDTYTPKVSCNCCGSDILKPE